MQKISSKEKEIKKIEKEILACKKCPLYRTRRNPVIGEGDLNAKILFCGEGPGFNEDREGRPFCGAAGKVLDELLESVGIKRKDVFVGNLLKCRPVTPNLENRAPNLEEISACSSYLMKQIEIIKPEIICTLGNYSTTFIFEKYGLKDKIEGISKIHGKVFSAFAKGYGGPAVARYSTSEGGEPKTLFGSIKIIPLYHPAVATYNPSMKEILLKDFQILKDAK